MGIERRAASDTGEPLMADGKWLAELTADTPLTDAARRALEVRLQVVRDHLPLAVEQEHHDPENVHQLRVATRRAGAVVRLFACCLPGKARKKAQKRLRRIRGAAGAARDWDVFLLELLERVQQQQAARRPGLDYLLGYATGQRSAAQVQLVETADKEGRRFGAFLHQTVAGVGPPDHHAQTLLYLARPMLGELLDDLEAKAKGDIEDYEHLHKVRIAGKRLRYAMEVFAGCFDATFKDDLYPQIEAMQEVLGRANDSQVASERLTALGEQTRTFAGGEWKRVQPGIADLLLFHRRRLPRERKAFVKWWSNWQRNGGPGLRALLG